MKFKPRYLLFLSSQLFFFFFSSSISHFITFEMWRKEQHFVTIRKDMNATPALDNGDCYSPGVLCDMKRISSNGSAAIPSWYPRRRQRTTGEGHIIYQGNEFDIFGSEPIIHTNPDDDPCTSRASTRLSIINHGQHQYGHSHHHHYHPHFQHHQTCPSLGSSNPKHSNKRKALVEEDSLLCDQETGNHKHCRLETTPSTAAAADRSRPSVLGTHFFLHTSPRGAPVDLFKPNDDKSSSNCFCTQHVIYS